MFGIRFDERVEEHTSPLDISNLSIGFENNAVERRKVTLGIDRSRNAGSRSHVRHLARTRVNEQYEAARRIKYLVEFQGQHLVSSLSNFNKVCQSSSFGRSLKASSLNNNNVSRSSH